MLFKKYYKIFLSFLLLMVISKNITFPQNLSSARGISIGAFTSLTNDINSIDWNPAGLTKIKDWEIDLSNYATANQKNFGLTLNLLGVGKRFFENHAAAFRYSPGFLLEFIIPTTFTLKDSNGNTVTTRFDKIISYTQNYSFGYSYRMYDNFSVGFAAKYFESNLSDTKYFFGSNNIIQSQVNNYTSSMWTCDIGSMFELNNYLSFGLVFKPVRFVI